MRTKKNIMYRKQELSDSSDSEIGPQGGDGGVFGSGVLVKVLDDLLKFLDISRSSLCIALKMISYMGTLYGSVIQPSEPRYEAL